MRILIVCSANKSRSPAYAAYLKHFLKENDITGIKVDSAGTKKKLIVMLKKGGYSRAYHIVRRLMDEEGIKEINRHKMKPISKKLVVESDLIVAMSEYNMDILVGLFPEAKNKIQMIKDGGVEDAHYHGQRYRKGVKTGTIKAYREMLAELRELAILFARNLEEQKKNW